MVNTIYLLTGDIGGTNSRMSLYEASCITDCSADKPLVVKYYRNSEHIPEDCHGHPEAFSTNIVMPFLKYCWEESEDKDKLKPLGQVQILAALATAGLVSNNRVNMTNLGNLLIDGTAIAANSNDKYLKRIVVCKIINDFVAQGYGCLTLKKDEVRPLFGPSNLDELPVGPKVCIGAGTGLGECYLTPKDSDEKETSYTCFPSEGGHVEYASRNDVEVSMFKYLNAKFCSNDRISVERVVSGKGLANVYEFLAQKYPTRIVESVHTEFINAGDEQGRVVAQNAGDVASLCTQAMAIMMSAYGCEAGSAAIKWIPTGGLFVTGGLTPKNIKYIEGLHTDFMVSYLNKGRVNPLLDRIPLFAVMVEDLGVRGAHKAALMEYEKFMGGGGAVRKASKFQKFLQENGLVLAATAALSFSVGLALSKRH